RAPSTHTIENWIVAVQTSTYATASSPTRLMTCLSEKGRKVLKDCSRVVGNSTASSRLAQACPSASSSAAILTETGRTIMPRDPTWLQTRTLFLPGDELPIYGSIRRLSCQRLSDSEATPEEIS